MHRVTEFDTHLTQSCGYAIILDPKGLEENDRRLLRRPTAGFDAIIAMLRTHISQPDVLNGFRFPFPSLIFCLISLARLSAFEHAL